MTGPKPQSRYAKSYKPTQSKYAAEYEAARRHSDPLHTAPAGEGDNFMGTGQSFENNLRNPKPFEGWGAVGKRAGKLAGGLAQGGAAALTLGITNRVIPKSLDMRGDTSAGEESPYEVAHAIGDAFPGPLALTAEGLGLFKGLSAKGGAVMDRLADPENMKWLGKTLGEGVAGAGQKVARTGKNIIGPDIVVDSKAAIDKARPFLTQVLLHSLPGRVRGKIAGYLLHRQGVPFFRDMGKAFSTTTDAEAKIATNKKMLAMFKLAGKEAQAEGSTLAMEPGLRNIEEEAAREAAEAAKFKAKLGMPGPRTAFKHPRDSGPSQLERELSKSLRAKPAVPPEPVVAPPAVEPVAPPAVEPAVLPPVEPVVAPPAAPAPAAPEDDVLQKLKEFYAKQGKPLPGSKPPDGSGGAAAALGLSLAGGQPPQQPGAQMPPQPGGMPQAQPQPMPLSANVKEAKGKALQAVMSGMVPMANLRDLLARAYDQPTVDFVMSAMPNRLPQ